MEGELRKTQNQIQPQQNQGSINQNNIPQQIPQEEKKDGEEENLPIFGIPRFMQKQAVQSVLKRFL